MAKENLITGIDIGTAKIAVVIATLGHADAAPHVIGASLSPSRGIKKGQIVAIEDAVDCITQCLEAAERMAGVSVSKVYVSVGGSHIQCQNSKGIVAVSNSNGEVASEDIRRVIDAAKAVQIPSSREILHVIPREYIVDGQSGIKDPVGMTGVRLEVETHIITGSTTALRNLAKCLDKVGVDIGGFVFGGLASAEAVLTETEKELGVVLADIGGGTTDVLVFIEGSLSHSAVLPMGARNITNDLAIGLRISLESAEKIKLELSKQPKFAVVAEENIELHSDKKRPHFQDDEINIKHLNLAEDVQKISKKTLVGGIIEPRLKEIFTYIGLELQRSNYGGLTPSGLVITGGGADTVGLIEACKTRLAMPCRVGLPQGISGLIDEVSGAENSTVVGLVIHAAREIGTKERPLSTLPVFGKISKVPIRNIIHKSIDFIKTFLP